jgi:hypothetical protein
MTQPAKLSMRVSGGPGGCNDPLLEGCDAYGCCPGPSAARGVGKLSASMTILSACGTHLAASSSQSCRPMNLPFRRASHVTRPFLTRRDTPLKPLDLGAAAAGATDAAPGLEPAAHAVRASGLVLAGFGPPPAAAAGSGGGAGSVLPLQVSAAAVGSSCTPRAARVCWNRAP